MCRLVYLTYVQVVPQLLQGMECFITQMPRWLLMQGRVAVIVVHGPLGCRCPELLYQFVINVHAMRQHPAGKLAGNFLHALNQLGQR
jgi:hypothetical protein